MDGWMDMRPSVPPMGVEGGLGGGWVMDGGMDGWTDGHEAFGAPNGGVGWWLGWPTLYRSVSLGE